MAELGRERTLDRGGVERTSREEKGMTGKGKKGARRFGIADLKGPKIRRKGRGGKRVVWGTIKLQSPGNAS